MDGKQEQQAQEPPTATAKNTWFQGFKDGNMKAPQTNFGNRIFMTAALMGDPPTKADEFINATLSSIQSDELLHAATGGHKAYGINAPRIQKQGVDRIWSFTKKNTTTSLSDLTLIFTQVPSTYVGERGVIEYLFTQCQNTEVFEKIKSIALAVKSSLLTSGSEDLLRILRSSFNRNEDKLNQLKQNPRMAEALKKTGLQIEDPELQKKCNAEIQRIVRGNLTLVLEQWGQENKLSDVVSAFRIF